MENHPYYHHPHSILQQPPLLPPYRPIPLQQNLPQPQPQIPLQQSPVHHHSQLQLHPVRSQLQQNHSQKTTVQTVLPIQQCVISNSTSTAPLRTPQPLDLTPKSNKKPPDPYQSYPSAQNQPQPHHDGNNYQSLVVSYNSLAQQNCRLAQQAKASKEAKKLFQDKATTYKSQVDSYHLQIVEMGKELEKCKALLNTVSISNVKFNHLVKKYEELDQSNKELQHQNEKLLSEEQNVSDLQIERDNLLKEKKLLTEQVDNLNEKVSNEITKHYKEQADWVVKQFKSVEQEMDLEATVERYKEIMKELQKELGSSQNSHKVEVEKLQENLSEAESQIFSLNSKLESSSTKNQKLLKDNCALLKAINILENDQLSSKKNVESLERKVQNLTKKLSETESAKENEGKIVESLNSDLNEFKNKLAVCEAQNVDQSETEKKLSDENWELKKILVAARADNKELVKSVSKWKGESESFKEKLKGVDDKNKELVAKVDDLEGQRKVFITKGENEMSELSKKLKYSEKQFQDSSIYIMKLRSELGKLKQTSSKELLQLKGEVESERERVEGLTRHLKEERARISRKSEAISSLRKIQTNLKAETKKIIPLMNQVVTLKLEKEHLSGQLDASLEEMRKLESTIEGLNGKVNTLLKSNEDLGQQVIEHKITIETLEKKVEENLTLIKKQEEEIYQKLSKKTFEIHKLNKKINCLKEKNKDSKTCIVELCSQLDGVNNVVKNDKISPFCITSVNILKSITNPLEEDSDDELPELPKGMNPTTETKKLTPNHDDDASFNWRSASKRVRWDFDLNNGNVTEKIEEYKHGRISGDTNSTEEIFEQYMKDLHEGKL